MLGYVNEGKNLSIFMLEDITQLGILKGQVNENDIKLITNIHTQIQL